ncbi:MAG TPA: serine/threonine-protein kinase [Kofleriaceae bacterium]|nr:serine/threonine-protein kinase [Kofleriaceae bacterium]
MLIQVGEVLDKYELLERVGQGGMAVVYRGLDRSLKRVVAVKILHKHLSDYQEARDRFEREAQAVAKLRHENILEIFDYSGADAAAAAGSSYIVTEFIDGQTLKQVITDRPIQFPEIGAMIVLQVSRALAHAHAAGILHRDVKPENIMIRSDGVVKLMDFGISHMLDLERLTVTGQLLGSPAYMAPEHVEGRQLDFRTDVFAAGIVLYQLTVGKLPFEGKNPHEVLKRIAECKFVDPRQANPMIGNRLGRIILRAMAAQPSDRYAAIGEMVIALEGYLEESGIAADKVPGELSRYFQAPVAYEQALETRLVDHLTTRGGKLLAEDQRSAALDVFDRVLTIDPDNEKVLKILDGINRRRRIRTLAVATLGVCVMGFCAYMIHRRSRPIDDEVVTAPPGGSVFEPRVRFGLGVPDELAEPHPVDAAPVVVVAEPDASGSGRVPATDAPVEPVASEIKIKVSPAKGSEVQVGDGAFAAVPADDGWIARSIDKEVVVRVRNACCATKEQIVRPGMAEVSFLLEFKPGSVTPKCDQPADVKIKYDGKEQVANLNQKSPVFFESSVLDIKPVTVEFFNKDTGIVTKKIDVRPGQSVDVTCAP